MKLPYAYRGLMMLGVLFVVLPWATWRFALRDTVAAWRDCRRLSRELAAVASSCPPPRIESWEVAEQLLSGRLLDTLRRHTPHGITVIGYAPIAGEAQEGTAVHTARLELAGGFHALLPAVRLLERHLPDCRIRSLEWRMRTVPGTRRRQLVLTVHVQQIVTENHMS